MPIIPLLPDQPLVFYGNNSLQNGIVQTLNLVDRQGQNFNTSIAKIARSDGGVIQNVNKQPLEISMNLGITNSFNVSDYIFHRDRIEDLKQTLDYSDRYLRVMHNGSYTIVDAPTASTSNITLTGAGTLSTSVTKPQILKHTYTCTAAASTSVVFARTFSPVDLSTELATSNVLNLPQFDFLIDVPKIRVLSSIDVRIGSSSSNYYEKTGIVLNYEELPLTQGKNILSIPFFQPNRTIATTLNFTETGTVNKTSISYVRIVFNLNATDSTAGYGYDGVIFSEDSKIRNYVSTPTGQVDIGQEMGDLVSSFPNFSFVCPSGYSRGTQRETVVNTTGVTTLTSTSDVFFYGNKVQLPTFRLKLNAITNLSTLRIRNVTENRTLEFNQGSTPWAVNDTIIFNAETKEITRNGGQQDTVLGRIPDFMNGNQTLEFSVVQSSGVTINTGAGVTTQELSTQSSYGIVIKRLLAQSFVCTQSGTIGSAIFKLSRNVGDFPGYVTVTAQLWSNSAGNPNALISSSASVNITATSATDVTFTFTSGAITNGTTYWVVLDWVTNFETGDTFSWWGSTSSTYASGQAKRWTSGGGWVNSSLADAQMIVVQEPTPATNIDYNVTYTRTYQ